MQLVANPKLGSLATRTEFSAPRPMKAPASMPKHRHLQQRQARLGHPDGLHPLGDFATFKCQAT